MDPNELRKLVNLPLSNAGFRGRASTWYREAEVGLQVLNLQRSAYGPQYYVNMGCVPAGMEVDGMPNPQEYKCPIRARLETAYPELGDEVALLFNLESAMGDESREARILSILDNNVIPFFERLRTTCGLKLEIERGVEGLLVSLTAYQHLGIRPIRSL